MKMQPLRFFEYISKTKQNLGVFYKKHFLENVISIEIAYLKNLKNLLVQNILKTIKQKNAKNSIFFFYFYANNFFLSRDRYRNCFIEKEVY